MNFGYYASLVKSVLMRVTQFSAHTVGKSQVMEGMQQTSQNTEITPVRPLTDNKTGSNGDLKTYRNRKEHDRPYKYIPEHVCIYIYRERDRLLIFPERTEILALKLGLRFPFYVKYTGNFVQVTQAGQVEGSRPDEERSTSPPGLGLGTGLTTQ